MTTVSVIIPCYRDSATLARALRSVEAQTYPAIEIVVVNDCSPETAEIEAVLAAFPRVRYVRNPVNVGLAATRNAGIAAASSDVVAFLDADDEYHPEKIAVQVAAVRPGRVVTCGVELVTVDGPGAAPQNVRPQPPPRLLTRVEDNLLRNTLNGAGLLASKDLLLRQGGFEPSLRSCEDFDLWLRLLESGVEVYDVGRRLYLYHYNPAGLSKSYRNISRWELAVVRRYIDRRGPEWRRSGACSRLVSVWLMRHLWRAERVGDDEIRREALSNTTLLDGFPLTQFAIIALGRSRLLRLAAYLLPGRVPASASPVAASEVARQSEQKTGPQ